MSTTTADVAPDSVQVARAEYDRTLAETRKFSAEQNKLAAEAAKLSLDRFTGPIVIVLGSLGSGLVVALLAHLWK